MQYENNFDRQTNIGNYIYPAIEEGIVRNFYWVVPGRSKEFKESILFIRKTLENLLKECGQKAEVRTEKQKDREGAIISTKYNGNDLIVCTLDTLPVLRQKVLLDIDTDFLVADSLLNVDSTKNIKTGKPWILPQDFVHMLKEKIKQPKFITIAYSVNGGNTPIIYKHFCDEIAYHLSPEEFKSHYENSYQAAQHFILFSSTGKKVHYLKDVKLNPEYRASDNNCGPLYLSFGKLSLAEKEYMKILRADPKNPSCILDMGEIASARKDFKKEKDHFTAAINTKENPLYHKTKIRAIWGLAKAEYALKNFKRAKELLIQYKSFEPLQSSIYFLLGRIFEKEKDFRQAATAYKDSIRFGYQHIDPIARLLQISPHLKDKNDIIKYTAIKYNEFKKRLTRKKKILSRRGEKVIGFRSVEEKMKTVEKRLYEVYNLRCQGGKTR